MKLDKAKIKKLVLNNLAYVIFAYAGNILCYSFRTADGKDVSEKSVPAMENLGTAFAHVIPSFHPVDILIGIIVGVAMKFIMKARAANKKKFRQGTEYGSAVWGSQKDIEPYMDLQNKDNNVILTQTESLTMGKPSHPKYARNKNILVIGGSGSGKTRLSNGKTVYQPYRIKVFNTIDFAKSMHYNPFSYISERNREKDILKFVDVLIKNTTSSQQSGGDDFWVKAEKLLYTSYIAMIFTLSPVDECPPSEEQKRLGAFAIKQYKAYKLAAGKTAKSILISCSTRLAPFAIDEVLEITSYDELGLDKLGDELSALFVIISDTDATFNFLVAIMYSQLFNLLCTKADNSKGGKLSYHVRCLLDEFANIGEIPQFEKLIATIRSREISASIILQAKSQLKAIYKDNADTIEGNCDTTLFLGGKEKSTLKEISESLGKETIDSYNTSNTRGQSESYGLNYQKLGKELKSQDELAVMDGGKCILQLRGVRPFFSDKFDITKHKNYKYLLDDNPKAEFDIGEFVGKRAKRYLTLRNDTEFEGFECQGE